MRKSYFILYYLCFLFLFVACDDDEGIEKFPEIVNKYNPDKPASLDRIIPTNGAIDHKFIVEGNFPGELEDMKVYFGDKQASIVGTDGVSITGIVPKQNDGFNPISVVVGNDSLSPNDLLFKYRQTRSVKTIAGKLGTDAWMDDADYNNADLGAVTFGEVHYVITAAGQKQDIVFAIEAGWGNRLFLLSLDDNKIQKLSTPFKLTCPAVPSTRDKFYSVNFDGGNDRTVHVFTKENSWASVSTGITVKRDDYSNLRTTSMTFADDDNLLYIYENEGRIAEVNLEKKSYKIYTYEDKKPANINEENFGGYITGDIPAQFGDFEDSYLSYSKYHKCFFASFTRVNAIYKLVKNEDNSWTSTLYAGLNGQGTNTGHRLNDAQFYAPHGIVVNEDGEMFVCNRSNPWGHAGDHCILKITGDVVEVVAGNPSSREPLVNGDPLESTFYSPSNMAIDFEGNYYIAGGWDRTVRKLSIE